MARRSSSLGPFPKTHRWGEIVQQVLDRPDAELSDRILGNVRKRLAGLTTEESATDVVSFFAALPIVTRSADPPDALQTSFGIRYRGSLRETLVAVTAADGALRRASLSAFDSFTSGPRFRQARIGGDEWTVWRELDGSAFCELGRTFYAHLCEELLTYYLQAALPSAEIPRETLKRHAWELSRITQAFSARWFNACALDATPPRSNIRWYHGHCVGKLDMELERELSTHVEPLPNPFRRKKVEPPSLGLPL
ncbi:hypothetical protein [Fimbriimonas ginsengisoli]|uniref:Uncharacterized protein n=1 Tax=Fimbriimonas ginsengisoli Gsoil 348 TaxID=661478 RepID=A0A068NSZ8_FIMGI|nr:hypothetical protein [Fimbriimonas ginsengisoli]AIE84749.1 hypothetical protein OP10G_1381 [Fimbriimonas ginsengisoli Gsoil 348]